MSVAIDTKGPFHASAPRPLFDDAFGFRVVNYAARYDVASDGRFLFVEEPPAAPNPSKLVLILHWGKQSALFP